MSLWELVLIAVGLSMDAFAVAVCKGLSMKKPNYGQGALIALFFGAFQALMPLIGWALGMRFIKYIAAYDHWAAFVLLVLIGGKMMIEASKKTDEEPESFDKLNIRELFLLAAATSIDALAVGVTFALLPDTDIWASVSLIGAITFLLSFAGVVIGNRFGSKYKNRAELFGGLILVAIGLKILIEHLSGKA